MKLGRLTAYGLLLAAAVGFVNAGAPSSGVNWSSDLHTARDEAVRTRKPILIVFGAEWCGFCKKLEKETLSDPSMAAVINERFVPVHLDLTDRAMTPSKKVAQILEVKTLPSCIVLSPEADLLGRVKGFQTPEAMYQHLTAAEQVHAEIRVTSGTASAE